MKPIPEQEEYRDPHYYWLFLFALIINGLLLLVLFLMTIETDFLKNLVLNKEKDEAPVLFEPFPSSAPTQPLPQPTMPEPIDPNQIAALKPGASSFGLPDEFEQESLTASMPICPESLLDDQNQEDMSILPDDVPEQEKIAPESPPQETPSLVQALFSSEQKTVEQNPLEQSPAEKNDKEPQKSLAKKRIPLPPQTEPLKAPLDKKEVESFKDLAKGFLASIDEGGQDLMKREGNENIRPDFEEMRYLTYLHKIGWYMQNEWMREANRKNYQVPFASVTGISLTVDKDGNLQDVRIAQSCGNPELDEAIVRGIRNASPYPPLPVHFKKDRMTFEFGVKHMPTYTQQSRPRVRY